MKNHLKVILEQVGRSSSFDNRSYYAKSVNSLLERGILSIRVNKPGWIWTRKGTGFKYNYSVTISEYNYFGFSEPITPATILSGCAKLLKDENVKGKVKADVTTVEPCQKCSGKGFIPQFSHVCNGVCFDCLGVGVERGTIYSVNIQESKI